MYHNKEQKEMSVTGISFINAYKQASPKVMLMATKKPGGQTYPTGLVRVENHSASIAGIAPLFANRPSSEGFVLDGFFLGTFEFDSLTGHPGIRY
ncbi:hypothetical protein ACD591_10820 [Rufibacter glacialis]|uniref:Uncharacterized protein n=1 Tax=Rufibacter glacialis TaxID=1259555 RepID=A0A5M8Q9C2_9BACT|nr:hypothetical protein [Rufibacter glacialis]KAA6431753.1 hypothetical protein FOE74_16675 [Rufibacter glacialis]GGK81896.1 hypothetical protein GCM10011405_32070 [Rufibacter glacialis]